jgi:hypothetical protein
MEDGLAGIVVAFGEAAGRNVGARQTVSPDRNPDHKGNP